MSTYTEKKRFCEKDTDHIIKSEFEKVFGFPYHTAGGQELFGSKIPDGWYVFNFEDRKDLMIIEDKKDHTLKGNGKIQLKTYYSLIKNKKQFKNIYLVLGLGTYSDFNYIIYKVEDHRMKQTKLRFSDLDKPTKQPFDIKEVHRFNNTMRDNGIELPKTQKILFVSAILLTLKVDPSFIEKYNLDTKGFIIAKEMVDVIDGYFKDSNLTKSFDFIKLYLNNDVLFKLFSILDKDLKTFNGDILKIFYNEFLKYSFDDEGKVGVVLTPDDIVELMIKELDIKDNESLMDCCTGTGSFLLKAHRLYKNLKLIGCENEYIKYSLVKINFILNNIDYSELYYNDCFKQTFSMSDHIILNPPFSTNQKVKDKKTIHNSERKFCLYQLNFLKEGGTGCWIIPRNKFNNAKQMYHRFKKEILENCQVLKIINCNPNLFGTMASSECVIIVFKKCKGIEKYETEVIDYSDDGYGYENGTRIKKKEGSIKSYKEVLEYNKDWNYSSFKNQDYYPEIINVFYNLKKIDYLKKIDELESKNLINDILIETLKYHEELTKLKKIEIKEWKKIKIGDYFEFVDDYKAFYVSKSKSGKFPLITRSKLNNGVTKYIDDYSLDGEYITIAPSGSTGATFYHNGKFAVDKMIKVMKLKKDKELDLQLFSIFCNNYLLNRYSYTKGLTKEKINETIINFPIFSEYDKVNILYPCIIKKD